MIVCQFAMEVERVAAAAGGVHGLQRAPGAMGGGTSSLLSAAVQEMLMVQKSNKAIRSRRGDAAPPARHRRAPRRSGGSVDRGGHGASAEARGAGVAVAGEEGRQEHAEAGAPPSPEEKRKV